MGHDDARFPGRQCHQARSAAGSGTGRRFVRPDGYRGHREQRRRGGSAVGTTLAKAAEIPVGAVAFTANRVVVTQPFKITNGAVVTGPATAPLPRRTIAVTDGDVRLLD